MGETMDAKQWQKNAAKLEIFEKQIPATRAQKIKAWVKYALRNRGAGGVADRAYHVVVSANQKICAAILNVGTVLLTSDAPISNG